MDEEREKHRQAALAAARADGPRYEAAVQRAMQQMGKVVNVHGLMMLFAAPRLLARRANEVSKSLTRELAAQYLDTYLDFIAQAKDKGRYDRNGQVERTEDLVRTARVLIETWSFSGPAPAPLVQTGRHYMAAFFGASEPDEWWDQWEGPEEDDDEEPPPAPT